MDLYSNQLNESLAISLEQLKRDIKSANETYVKQFIISFHVLGNKRPLKASIDEV
jgi:hypothetical protein